MQRAWSLSKYWGKENRHHILIWLWKMHWLLSLHRASQYVKNRGDKIWINSECKYSRKLLWVPPPVPNPKLEIAQKYQNKAKYQQQSLVKVDNSEVQLHREKPMSVFPLCHLLQLCPLHWFLQHFMQAACWRQHWKMSPQCAFNFPNKLLCSLRK